MATGIFTSNVDNSTPNTLPYLDPEYGDSIFVKNVGLETVYFASIDTRSSNQLVTSGYPLTPGESVVFPASVAADFRQTGFNTVSGTSLIACVYAEASPQSS